MSLILVDRYQIIESWGKDERGETFLGVDLHTPSNRKIVIKSLESPVQDTNPEILAKLFSKEASILEKLGADYEQIPTLYASFCEQDKYFLVQEYIEGKNLIQLGVLSPQECRRILASVLEVLKNIHSQNIIHQDIKPENIVIRDHDRLPILVNFSRISEAIGNDTTTFTSVNTKLYLAPEQSVGRTVFSTDLYSLSLTIIYCLTGKTPKQIPIDQITGQLQWQTFATNIDDQLATLLTKGSQMDLGSRYLTCEQMLEELNLPINTIAVAKENTKTKSIPLEKEVISETEKLVKPTVSKNISTQDTVNTEKDSSTVKREPKKYHYPNEKSKDDRTQENKNLIIICLSLFTIGAIGSFLVFRPQSVVDGGGLAPEPEPEPLEWQFACGDEGTPDIGQWWAVRGDFSALSMIKNNYCGDAYPISKSEIQIASFLSESKANNFAIRLTFDWLD